MSVCLSNYLSIYLFIYLYFYLPTYPSIYLSIHLSIYPSIHLSIHPSVYRFIFLSIYLSIYPSISTRTGWILCVYVCLWANKHNCWGICQDTNFVSFHCNRTGLPCFATSSHLGVLRHLDLLAVNKQVQTKHWKQIIRNNVLFIPAQQENHLPNTSLGILTAVHLCFHLSQLLMPC